MKLTLYKLNSNAKINTGTKNMNNKSKNLFLGFLFTLLILVSITAISAADTNNTSTQIEKQDVATQTIEPVKKTTSIQVTKTQETNDNKIKTTTKENKKETNTKTTTQKQDTTNNVQTTSNTPTTQNQDTTNKIQTTNTNKSIKQAYALGGWKTNKNNQTQKTIKTTTKNLKQEEAGTFTQLASEITNDKTGTIKLNKNYTRGTSESIITISKDITIDGQGYTLNANGKAGIFTITSGNVILNNMTITNSTSSAITISKGANVTENNINATNNNANYGGVNYNSGTLTINNGKYTHNTAGYNGGVNYNSGTLTINNGTYTHNTAVKGGVNYNNYDANSTINNGTYTHNTAKYGGVNFHNYDGTLTINNGTYTNNTARMGGIHCLFLGGTLTINNGNYTNNNGKYVIYNDRGKILNIVNVSFINNTCSSGDLFNKPTVNSNNTYIGNNLTVATVTINPNINTITSKYPININITIKPNDRYNTTINNGNITIYEDNVIVKTNPVKDNSSSIIYTPHKGEYILTIAYTDFTNSYKTTTIRTIKVNIPGTFTDLQTIIDETKEDKTLILDRNYIRENGESAIIINKTITINGQGHILNANGYEGIFTITARNVILSNMTITNSKYSSAITIQNGASLTENNIKATNNTASDGGVNKNYGNLTINNAKYTNNNAGRGGVNYNSGTLTINNGTYTNNTASDSGVVNYNIGTLTINNGTFTNNNAGYKGGVNYNSGTLTINNGTFTNNTASDSGGVNLNYGTLTINNGTFTNNTANNGGVNLNYGTLTINNGTYTNNTANNYGGVNYNSGTLTINNGTYKNNTANNYGGVNFNAVTLILNNATCTHNNAKEGGVNYNSGTLTINNGTYKNNTATNGGINYNKGNLTIINATFTNNTATNGGINYNNGNLTINNATFTNNTAKQRGGVNYDEAGNLIIKNGTFMGNKAVNGSVYYTSFIETIGVHGSLIVKNGVFCNNTGQYTIYSDSYFSVENCLFENNNCNNTLFNETLKSSYIISIKNNTYVGNNLTVPTIITSITNITSIIPTTVSVKLKAHDIYNATINTGNLTLIDNRGVVETILVTKGEESTIYTPHVGEYNLTIGYTDLTNSYKTTTNKIITVNIPQPATGTFTDLQIIIDKTKEGKTLILDRNYTRENGESVITINKTITINGDGYTLNANGYEGIFNITARNVILSNMTITNSKYSSAITIQKDASLTENNINATNNTAIDGGVNKNYGNLTINNAKYTNNTAIQSGGVNYNSGTLTINNGTYTNNNAGYKGGVNYNDKGTITINNGTYKNNTASDSGGINSNYGKLTINNGTYNNNTAKYGGINLNYGTLTINNGTYTNNTANNYGGVNFNAGTLTINNGTYTNNTANNYGGVNYNAVTLTINNATCTHNNAKEGGVNYNNYEGGTLTINNGTYKNNTANNYGCVNSNYGNLIINNGTYVNNNGNYLVYHDGNIFNVVNALFINNSCSKGDLFNKQPNVISNNTYSGNNLTATLEITINPNINTITSKYPININITIKPKDMYNTTTNSGNLTIYEDNVIVQTSPVNNNISSIIYTPCGREYIFNLTIAYTDLTNSYKTTTNKTIQVNFGTFTDLQNMINNDKTGTITLTKNYIRESTENRISINKSITINGQGHILNASGYAGIFGITAQNVILNNMTITNSIGDSAIAIGEGASLTENNINATNNNANYGGVNYNKGTLTINNGTFTNNNADWGGVNLIFYGTITINNGTYTNNTANKGGVNYNFETLIINNGTFINNTAKTYGGVNYNTENLIINNGTFTNNKGGYTGGVNYNTKTLTINNGKYINNKADYLIYNVIYKTCYLSVVNASFINNSCIALFNEHDGEISNNTYIGNNLTATMDIIINPDISSITSRDYITASITIKPNDMYNTTINVGNLTIYEDNVIVQTSPVNNNISSIIYTPHGGKYNLTIAYTDLTNSYKTTTNKTIQVNLPLTFKELQKLIDDTTKGTTATLLGNYTRVAGEDTVTISKDITIEGKGYTLNANGYEGIFNITGGNVILNNMTITKSTGKISAITIERGANVTENNINATNNNAEYGGVNNNEGNLTINNSTYTNNNATEDGGVNYNWKGNLTINNSTYTNNTAEYISGVNYNYGNLTINNSTYTNNNAEYGGVNYNAGTLTINNSTYTNNTATEYGGVNYNVGNLTINNGTYTNNTATRGGVNYNDNGNLIINNGTYTNNTATNGGVNYNIEGNLTINNGNYTNNKGDYLVYNNNGKVLNVVNATFINNTYSNGDLFNIKPDVISGNTYIGNNLTATLDITITPRTEPITSKDPITVNITIKPKDMYNTTINIGNLTIYEDGKIVQTSPINNNISSIITYTPHGGQYNLTIAYTDLTNSYITTTNKTIEVNLEKTNTRVDVTVLNNTRGNTTIKVTVIDLDTGKNIPYANVNITLPDKTNKTVTTNENGTIDTTINLTEGPNTITTTYSGNKIYDESSIITSIRVEILPTITVENITTKINDTTTITINLKDEQRNPISGGRVILKINGKTIKDENGNIVYANVTDGKADITTSFNLKVGTYPLTVVYGGYSYYMPVKTTNTTLTITPREAKLAFEDVKPAVIGSEVSFKIKVTDNDTPINTGRVIIKLNGRTVRDSNGNIIYTTLENGIANIKFTIPDTYKAKTYPLTVVYGDKSYNRAENTTPIDLITPINTLQTIYTSIITDAHTIQSNDSTTETIYNIS